MVALGHHPANSGMIFKTPTYLFDMISFEYVTDSSTISMDIIVSSYQDKNVAIDNLINRMSCHQLNFK